MSKRAKTEMEPSLKDLSETVESQTRLLATQIEQLQAKRIAVNTAMNLELTNIDAEIERKSGVLNAALSLLAMASTSEHVE